MSRPPISCPLVYRDHSRANLNKRPAKSAAKAEIVSFSGHAVNSPIPVNKGQAEETALNAIRKMGSYSTDEHEPEKTR